MALVRACRRFYSQEAGFARIETNLFLRGAGPPRSAIECGVRERSREAMRETANGGPPASRNQARQHFSYCLRDRSRRLRMARTLSSRRVAILDCKPKVLELPVKELLTDSGNSD